MLEAVEKADRIILGIDPGTNVTGYGVLGIYGKTPRLISLGIIELTKTGDHYMRLSHIHRRVTEIVEEFLPDELAIEAPFFGKNVQSMLKLGRAQGVAIAAAIARDVPITEYEPRKIKMAITGNGAASKEQVCEMLRRILNIPAEALDTKLDATDGLAAALCHFYESGKPAIAKGPKSWKDFIARNPDKVSGL
ncbi:MAG: crossover junction endodeoxyribonuclease RuvC [Muribaculaceae bacterium]|nr:crossover junction endodeoxyribonuclease RuvC [Muribaculaceae bacterium]